MSLIWINGQWHDRDSAKISVYDHGLLYGDGVFEGMRVYGGRCFRLQEHLDRLYDSAHAIWITVPIAEGGDGAASPRRGSRGPGSPRGTCGTS